jgi:uncharacterized protein YjdB
VGVGGTLELSASGTAVSGANVYYWSSDPAVASVGTWTGVVTAHREGTVRITGVAQAPGYPSATAQVTVSGSVPAPTPAPTIEPIVLSPGATSLGVGAALQLSASGTAVSGANVYYWSSDPTVATVGPWTGVVTALRPGSVKITGVAQAPGYPATQMRVDVH